MAHIQRSIYPRHSAYYRCCNPTLEVISMRIDDNDVPHIQAQCAGCGFLFDMKFGNDCPACHHIGVKWARLIKCATCGDTGNVNGEPCEGCTMESQRALLCSPYAHTEGDTKDISELDRMFALEDNR